MAQLIMTVDDSAVIRQMISMTLQAAGYRVVEASDATEALKLLQPEIQLILTDLNMPGDNGIELTRAIRRSDTNRTTPIVLITTESELSKKQEAKAAGATGWMVKPFLPEQLIATVRKVML